MEEQKMTLDGFGRFLSERGFSEEQISARIEIAAGFEAFLEAQHGNGALDRPPDKADLLAFSELMIENEQNNWDNYYTLVLYGRYLKNEAVLITALTLIDGAEAMDTLYHKLGDVVSPEDREKLFEGADRPVLGSDTAEWPSVTQVVIERVVDELGEEDTIKILADSLRYLEDGWYKEAKAGYENSQDIDEFLVHKGNHLIEQLEKHRDEGTLFFTQPVTQEVIDFVESQPEIRQGVRQGSILYETKIPYLTTKFLAESDPDKRRYYYCHCPWVRESLQMDEVDVPPIFCNCSAGFHKKYWEVVLGQPLKAQVLETVLQGDERCRFAIHLPENVLP
jgi:hypothetical protein